MTYLHTILLNKIRFEIGETSPPFKQSDVWREIEGAFFI